MRNQHLIFGLLICSLLAIRAIAQPTPFPLKVSSNNRHLLDSHGKPFPILGRTAWFILSQGEPDYKYFIDDCLKYGYNAIELHVINHDPRGAHPPFNGARALPFLKRLDGKAWDGTLKYQNADEEAPDLTTPNETYWRFVDGFLSYCRAKGILVFLFPVYVGYPGTDQGWMQELTSNGAERAGKFGAWIATRYKHQDNIVWMLLGDRSDLDPAQQAGEAGLVKGLKSVKDQQSPHYSAECESDQCSADHPAFGKEMTLNGAYSWAHVVKSVHDAYTHAPTMPSFLLEEPYDEEGPEGNQINTFATQPVRRYQWWGWLGTIGGYMSGNGYVWPFREGVWKEHLATPNTVDMMHLNKFIRSIRWWTLIPGGSAGMKDLVLSDPEELSDTLHVAAAASGSGDLLVAYIPPMNPGTVTVDVTVMKGSIQAFWFDPSSGDLVKANESVSIGKPILFRLPGVNKRGEKDWVLVLSSSKARISP